MSSYQPKISIVIPVYNGANYVAEAIDSALAQSYSNTEILVINDGSTDDGATARIARSYGDRIRYVEKPNGGVATALNLGIEEMTGDYFSWLSHDDLYLPEKLATQVQVLEGLEDRDVVLYSDYQLIDESSKVTNIVRLDHQTLAAKPLYGVLRGSIHGCSTLVPRSAFERYGKFDPELKTTQDYALWFEMARHLRFVHLPKVLISSRWHPEQGSKTQPATMREANELWIGFADKLSQAEMLRCEPTVYKFHRGLADFLAESPYAEAQAEMEKRAEAEKRKVVETTGEHKVSVVIPVYNRIPLAVEALHSVLAQQHQNFEVLVVNNASTEDLAPLASLSEGDPRIQMLECPTGGASGARNLGIERAKGEFIAFLDADDIWLPNKLSEQLQGMLLYGDPVSYTDYETFSESGSQGGVSCAVPSPFYATLVASCPISTPTVMIAASILKSHPQWRFREEFELGEDICLWIDLARELSFLHLPQALTRVRLHKDSAADRPEKRIVGLLNIVSHIGKQEALFEAPLAVGRLIRSASRELEKIGAERLLDSTADGLPLWPNAPISSRLANRVGQSYWSLPKVLRPGLRKLVLWMLLRLDTQARREPSRLAKVRRVYRRFRPR